ncbi:MAG: hypothetical protein HY554_16670 [Elusimicrobia bacterium]|nr:hypothetical protein [Elusimicrobiota bacterium]
MRLNLMMAGVLALAATAHAQVEGPDSAREALQAAREGARQADSEIATRETAPAEEGWPELPPYERTHPEVSALNQTLARNGVDARVYRVDPARCRVPPTLRQTYIIVYRSGESRVVPFSDSQRGWSQLLGLEVVGGGVLASKNEHGTVYTDLGAGPSTEAAGVVGVYARRPEDGKGNIVWASHPDALAHMLAAARFSDANRERIVGRLREIIGGGLPAGTRIDGEELLLDIPKGARFTVAGNAPADKPDAQKLVVLSVTGKISLTLWPTEKLGAPQE